MYQDLFVDGYDDMAILQSTYLTDFYKNGFNTIERNAAMKERASRSLHPQRRIRSARRRGKGLEHWMRWRRKYKIKGVKLYTAEWRGRKPRLQADRSDGLPISGEGARSSASRTSTCTRARRSFRSKSDAFDVADIDRCRDRSSRT